MAGRQVGLAPGRTAEDHPGGKGREHRPCKLGDQVERRELPGELARGGHTERDGGIDVRPRYVSHGGHHDREGESEGQRHGQRAVSGAGRRERQDGRYRNGDPSEYEDKGPDEFRQGAAQHVAAVYLTPV